jgi:hypothetical protein
VNPLAYSQHTCPCKIYPWLQQEISTRIILHHRPWPLHPLLLTTDCHYLIYNRKNNFRVSSCLLGQVPWCLPKLVDLHLPSLQQSLSELLAKNRGRGKIVSGESFNVQRKQCSKCLFVILASNFWWSRNNTADCLCSF